jgi:uncharacterized membrane protein YdjX (TVP38/TMEM64 family)
MTDPVAPSRFPIARWLPVIALAAGLGLFLAFGLHEHVGFHALARHRHALNAWVASHPWLAPVVYVGVYVAAVAFSVPGGVWFTIAGGFLFGLFPGVLYAVIGATLGAIGLFIAARTAFGDVLRAKAGPAIQRMEAGFRENALSYLLFLRLVPIFPFFLVNLVPAFLGVSLRSYAVATFLGVIPGTTVFASVGNGLGAVLDAGGTPDLGIILKPSILFPILGLALLALIPVVYKRLREARG